MEINFRMKNLLGNLEFRLRGYILMEFHDIGSKLNFIVTEKSWKESEIN